MYRNENLASGNPQLECPDDSVCYQCGNKLPEINDDKTDKQYFAFEGFCGPGCAAMTLSGIHTHAYTKEFMRLIAKYAKVGESSDEHIVKCVNAHDDLVAALQMVCDSGVALAYSIENAMLKALAKAGGEQ